MYIYAIAAFVTIEVGGMDLEGMEVAEFFFFFFFTFSFQSKDSKQPENLFIFSSLLISVSLLPPTSKQSINVLYLL